MPRGPDWATILVTGTRRDQNLAVWNAAAEVLDQHSGTMTTIELAERLWPQQDVIGVTIAKLHRRFVRIILELKKEAPSYYSKGEEFTWMGATAHRSVWHKGNRLELSAPRQPQGSSLIARVAALELELVELKARVEILEALQ